MCIWILRPKGCEKRAANASARTWIRFRMRLANFFGDKTKKEYKRDLQRAYNEKQRYYLLQKAITFDQFKELRTFPLVRMGRNKSGVIVEVRTKRLNPLGLLARRTIGLARQNAQNVGLERTYDSLLKGATGKRLVRFIAGGAAVPVEGYDIDPENGKDIVTTLDVTIQDIAETALLKMMQQSESQYGTCIVMETATGKIKAIANLGATKKGGYDENLNYALQTTEPGSTIKLATLLSVLESGSSSLGDLVEVGTTGNQFVAVRNVNDAERSPKPVLTVKECFAHSSNVGFAKLANKAFAENPTAFKAYLEKFHLTKTTGIGLVGEEPTVLPRWKRNKEGLHAMLTMSFGYAIEVSPLHTLMLYNAIANDGKLMKPYLVSSIKSNGLTVKKFEPTILDEAICKPETVKAAQQCMEAVVTEGTGKPAFEGVSFPIAGKTGTAHVAGGDIKYYDGVYQASFAGYFPANNPKYTCIVVIKTKPHAAQHYGGQLAAPVFREVAIKLYAMYIQQKSGTPVQLEADSLERTYAGNADDIKDVLKEVGVAYKDSANKASWSQVSETVQQTTLKPALAGKAIMPDVRNMTLKDALYLLESKGVKVTAKGKGKVLMQDIAPGTNITKAQTVTLLLN
jgi:cell division protein FtsI (penicillin-binding protein 3)